MAPCLRSLPMRMGKNKVPGLTKACKWVMACLVLHNFLCKLQQEDDMQWLPAPMQTGDNAREPTMAESGNDKRCGYDRRGGAQTTEEG